MKKIKVLFISHSPEMGGAEKALIDILVNLDKDSFEGYLTVPKSGEMEKIVKRLGVRTFVIDYRYWLMLKLSLLRYLLYIPLNIIGAVRIAVLVKKLGIDIVFTNTCTVISGALAAKMCGKAHIWSIHEMIGKGSDTFKGPFPAKAALSIINSLSKSIIVDSRFIGSVFPEEYQGKICAVYYGFNVDLYVSKKMEREELRKQYGIKEDEKVISLIGTICELKGQMNAVLAMPAIAQNFSESRLLLAGAVFGQHKKYAEEVKVVIAKSNMSKQVLLTGFKKEISEIYKISDCVILPSSVEAFGRVIVEAMLAGVPVIASRVGGIPEIITNGVDGVLIDSRTPESIAEAVTSLFKTPEIMIQYAENARRSATERFSAKTMINNIEKILRQTNSGSNVEHV